MAVVTLGMEDDLVGEEEEEDASSLSSTPQHQAGLAIKNPAKKKQKNPPKKKLKMFVFWVFLIFNFYENNTNFSL